MSVSETLQHFSDTLAKPSPSPSTRREREWLVRSGRVGAQDATSGSFLGPGIQALKRLEDVIHRGSVQRMHEATLLETLEALEGGNQGILNEGPVGGGK